MRRAVVMCALLGGWLASAAAADVVTIEPVRDNTLFQDATGSLSNGAGPVLYAGNTGQGLARRTLVRFDIAAHVPAGARIDDVQLTLNVSSVPNTILRVFTLHRALEDWGEGTSSTTSGSGAPATSGDATWLHTFWPDEFWSSAGGVFSASISAAQSVGDLGHYAWSNPAMAADVQSWLDQPAGDFGWLILGDEVTLNTARRFDSRENSVVANRPLLRITYTLVVGIADRGVTGVSMEPPHPNPAAGPVRAGFVLAAPGEVRFEVWDLAGRRVATPLARVLPAGHHEALWDARDADGGRMASGIYCYRMIVDGRLAAAGRVAILH
jgi:hypothetical protein